MTYAHPSCPLPPSFAERFWAKVSIPLLADHTPDYDACWLWTAGLSQGAGTVRGVIRQAGRGSKLLYAHRAALILVTGSNPDHMDACHAEYCISPLCCNAHRHLFWGTHRENMRMFAAMYGRRANGQWRSAAELPERPQPLYPPGYDLVPF